MALVRRVFPNTKIIATFWEAPGGGDATDINSLCNRPAADPQNWLANILHHSDLQLAEVAASGSVTRSQSAAPAATNPSGSTGGVANTYYGYRSTVEDFAILTHGQGAPPYACVIVDGKVLNGTMVVQTGTGGAVRYATAYCTDTEIRVETWCSIGVDALPDASITYEAIAIRAPRAKSGNVLKRFDPETGIYEMGFNRFSADRKYLQAVDDGDTQFAMMLGEGIDNQNGAARIADAGEVVTDTVPSTAKMAIVTSGLTYGPGVTPTVWGSSQSYDGAFAAPNSFLLQVPDDPPGGESGYRFDQVNQKQEYIYLGRSTFTTSGKLLALLDEDTYSGTLSFPAFTTRANYFWGYHYRWTSITPPLTYAWGSYGTAWVAAIEQDHETVVTLATVPDGVDFVFGLVKLNRTTAPAAWCYSDPLEALPKQNVWIPFAGSLSMQMEAATGMVRTLSIYIEGGALKMKTRQSVSKPPGGFQSWNWSGTIGGYPWYQYAEHYDGGGYPGIPLVFGARKDDGSAGGDFTHNDTLHKWNGADPPVVPSTPATASVSSIDLAFTLGSRS